MKKLQCCLIWSRKSFRKCWSVWPGALRRNRKKACGYSRLHRVGWLDIRWTCCADGKGPMEYICSQAGCKHLLVLLGCWVRCSVAEEIVLAATLGVLANHHRLAWHTLVCEPGLTVSFGTGVFLYWGHRPAVRAHLPLPIDDKTSPDKMLNSTLAPLLQFTLLRLWVRPELAGPAASFADWMLRGLGTRFVLFF